MTDVPSKPSSRRDRQIPYRLMCMILYGGYEWAQWDGGRVTIRTGPLSRKLRVSSAKFREYLRWLLIKGYISELELSYGKARFQVVIPARWAITIQQLRGSDGA